MIVNIFMFVISIILINVLIHLACIEIKKSNRLDEKMIYGAVTIVLLVIFFIYFVDRYNIPTYFKLGENVNSQNWLSLIGNYLAGTVSAIIGGLVVVWTTIYQVKKNSEDNEKRNMESLRLQNLPLIKYDINTERKGTADLTELIVTNLEYASGNVYYLNIILKSIGMNSIKNVIVDFSSAVVNNSTCRLIGKEAVCPMEKGEVIEINRYFSLNPSDKYYEMNLIIYYQDVFSNWYNQEIMIHYYASSEFKKGKCIGSVSYDVKEEVRITEDEIEGFDI